MKNKNISKKILYLLSIILPLSMTACNNDNNLTSTMTGNTSLSISDSSTNITNSAISSVTSTGTNSSIISSTIQSNVSSTMTSNSSDNSSSDVENNIITIAQAIEIAKASGEKLTDIEYQVKGTILEVSDSTYGEMTIQDETGSLYIYGVYGKDRETRYDKLGDEKPVRGDEITLSGKLKMYNGSPEMDRGYIVDFKHKDVSENVDLSQYTEKTIKEVRDAEAGTKVKITGIVAQFTYAFGMEVNGFYLVSDDASIYVYDTQVSPQLNIGNTITIVGEKTYYVLSTEQNSANKFGYKGSCQISDIYLLENDKEKSSIDLSWCKETTIKDIMDTPVTENITTDIFKVNAVVNRVEGHDFVNYYFNDLDNETGSYAYSQNSGSDFEYLKEFNGKICTVYLSPINCKSTDTGCFYRFIPIQVSYDNFEFNLENAPNFAIDYYALDQFRTLYYVDPRQELLTSVSSSLLGFEDVKLSYSSDNTNVAYFEENEDSIIFHTDKRGEANITITAKYNNYTSSKNIKINVALLAEMDCENVMGAIGAEDGEEVTVKGIVASSLVNKQGFYLVDDTGLIAIEVSNSDILKEFTIGNEIIVKGIKEHQKKATGTNIGQAVIAEATLVANLYGDSEYSTKSFKDVTFDELYTLTSDVNTDYTTQGYKVSGTIIKESTDFYTNYYLGNSDNTKKILFYCSDGNTQYGYLLEDYVNQEIIMEVALCNWNSAKYNRLCALSVITETGKKINTLNWN